MRTASLHWACQAEACARVGGGMLQGFAAHGACGCEYRGHGWDPAPQRAQPSPSMSPYPSVPIPFPGARSAGSHPHVDVVGHHITRWHVQVPKSPRFLLLVGLQGVRPGEQRRLSCTSYLLMGLIWPNPCVPRCPLHIHMVPRTPVRRVSEGTERLN